ncbi:MAG: bifunctional diaminohydroxyphosphoribosylaminopyrimidine deaminase/5-amino-6-(5-phosphoribosylamino)uracil reductase RibD [Armatimonadetes bacterium]|nr:bifunctional diaminohydroxyphosphoribosylaminopyrimidine deaminase/5-amino-6-(5-phosphoribosylamino)uracil reductase RibD [Armatimonadota bacterium]PIU65993.1 MAG: riboflavin biosynthesis protein RibD [Armatimonadetes bacterium CG07_land_8_20_14_0_80_59_28]PIX38556.1 MAG: riboflavin biosynthesis protein RibD [Armatimonadetes bacterium CG_4_8_14_3_um_filter_58_9]
MEREFMRRALREARKGLGWTSPNPCVGAVVVQNGEVVGAGYTRPAGERHAEYFALRQAGKGARGASVYTTLEPCCYYGRTPACTEELLASGVRKVVSGVRDPNPRVDGEGFRQLQRAGVETAVGLCAREATRQMEGYLKFVETGLPFVTLKMAMTLDGKIASPSGESKWISGESARRHVHQLRHENDAVIVGINTVLRDDPQLTARHRKRVRNPHRVVLDGRARTPVKSHLLRESLSCGGKTIIVVSRDANPRRVSELNQAGAEVWQAPLSRGGISLRWVLRRLGKMDCRGVIFEGGSEVAASALETGIVDRVLLFVAPKLLGGRDAIPVIGGRGLGSLGKAAVVREWTTRRMGEDLMIEGALSPPLVRAEETAG